jgi:hypothetical protein
MEAQQAARMSATQTFMRTNNNFGGNNTVLKSPLSNFGGPFPKASPHTGFGVHITGTQFDFNPAPVNVNEDHLRPLSGTESDPIALFMATMNKLNFLTMQVKPSLDKDLRLVQVEAFCKVLFSRTHRETYGRNG